MEGSCKYIEQEVAGSRKRGISPAWGLEKCQQILTVKKTHDVTNNL
jgi:hypothetical protein